MIAPLAGAGEMVTVLEFKKVKLVMTPFTRTLTCRGSRYGNENA